MDEKEMLSKAIDSTGASTPDTDASQEETQPADDGTATISASIVPEETKEGDIIQFEVLVKKDDELIIKPVESRIKQPENKAEPGTNGKMSLDDAIGQAMKGKQ